LLAPTDLMVGVLSACYTRRPQGVTHGQSRCTVLSVRRRVGRDPPQIPKLTVRVRFPSPAPTERPRSAACRRSGPSSLCAVGRCRAGLLKRLRLTGPPFTPTNMSPSEPGAACFARWRAMSGRIKRGRATTRRPAADFGGRAASFRLRVRCRPRRPEPGRAQRPRVDAVGRPARPSEGSRTCRAAPGRGSDPALDQR
jgi:hypothetical protein